MRIAAERIALVKLGALGDVVNSLPFVQRLRAGYPHAEITWIIGPAAHALVAGHPAVDRFLVFDARDRTRWRAFLQELRARHFELVIDLQRILKSGVITRASGAQHRLGFDRARCKEGSWLFTNLELAPNPQPGVTLEQYLEFADFLECPPRPPSWELPFTPFPAPADGRPRVVVNVGATKPANRWYPDRWARVCEALVSECGAEVCLSGGPSDRADVDEVARQCAAPLSDHAGKLALRESVGLIRSARLFIGCDTGPMHIAAAVGTPVLALFGAADPARTGPFGAEHVVLTHPVPCSPCRRRHCNVAGHPCMTGLAEERVIERAKAMLGAPRPR